MAEQAIEIITEFQELPPISETTDYRGKRTIEQKVTIAGIVLVVLTLMISTGVNIVTDFVEAGAGPEYGYRLDVDPELYEDLGANRWPFASGASYPSFSSTVFIEGVCVSDPDYYCGGSGVIISSKWVLTAAHVVQELILDETYVVVGSDWQNAENLIEVENFYIHPSWEGTDEELPNGFDIALIELADSSGVYPSSWANYEGKDDSLLGATIFVSGFGNYDNYDGSYCDSACLNDGDEYYSQRRAWGNTLDRIVEMPPIASGGAGGEMKGGHIVYDFDSPNGTKNSLVRGNLGFNIFTNQDYYYAGNGDSSSVPHSLEGTGVYGDSGGPVFAKIGS